MLSTSYVVFFLSVFVFSRVSCQTQITANVLSNSGNDLTRSDVNPNVCPTDKPLKLCSIGNNEANFDACSRRGCCYDRVRTGCYFPEKTAGRVICDLGCDKLLITKGSAVLVENAVHNYGNNEHSRLRIMGPCRIVIAKLDVEASTSCRYDYLRILGVPYCKWQSNPIKLPEGEHLVHWRSNSHTTQFGFQIRVEREQPKQATTLSRSALAGDRTLRSFPDDAKNNHRAVVNKANENTGKKNETGVTPQVLAAIYMPENATQDANQANDELSGSGEVMNESHHVERLKSASSKSTSTAAIVLGAGGISLMAVGIGCLCAWARNAKKENPFVEAGFGTGYDYGDTSLTWGLPPGRR